MVQCGVWEPKEREEGVHKESGLERDGSPSWVRGGHARE